MPALSGKIPQIPVSAVGSGGSASEVHADVSACKVQVQYINNPQFLMGSQPFKNFPSILKRDDALLDGYEQQLNDQTPQVIKQAKESYHSGNAWKKVPIVSGAIGHRVAHNVDAKKGKTTQIAAKGRLDILDQIDNTLSPHTDGLLIDAPKRNLLKGYGGVGKTTLAAWYARSHRKEYEVVIWFQANEPLEKQFQERAHEVFGLPLPDESSTHRAKVDLVKSFYATLSQFDRWLIVFDDVKNPKDIAPFLPRAHAKESYGDDLLATFGSSQAIKKGCLITSRYNQWGLDPSMAVFNLDGFTPDEVMDFLRKRLKKPYSKEEALRLSTAFDAHPYALQQAANYINQNVTVRNITQYLERLEAEPELVFSDESAKAVLSDDASYSHHVLKAMSLSVDDFLACSQAFPDLDKGVKEQIKHLSLAVIGCLGYLNPGKLPYSLVESIIKQAIVLGDISSSLKTDALRIELSGKVLKNLYEHGIVRLEEDENGREGESFVLHQLMRLTFHLKKYQQNPKYIHRILIKAFASCVVYDGYHPEKNAGIAPYINQASYYLNANHSNVDKKSSDDWFNLCVNLGEYYLFQYNHFDEANDFFLKAEACLEHLACSDNSSKEQKAKLFNGMGFILHRHLGKFNEALDYLKKTLSLWGDSKGKVSHLLSVRALCSMGYIEVDRRHSSVAKAHYDTALQFLQSAKNKLDKAYAIELSLVQSALGDYHLQDGDVKKAKQFYFDSEKQRKMIYPDGHPELHILRNKIVEAYRKENNYDAAIEQLEKMASIQKKQSGYSVDYLDVCYQMAACYQEKSELKKAEELRSKNLNIIRSHSPLLLKQKGLFNTRFLRLVIQFAHIEALQLLMKKDYLSPKDKQEALLMAAYYGHLRMVKLLINEGVSATESGKEGLTPLLMASFKGHLPVMEWLLGEGKSSLDEKDKDGNTALLWAAREGRLPIVKALVSRGASLTESNNIGGTPLLIASWKGHLPVVEWLLNEKKSFLDEKDKHGYTALLWAAREGHLPIVKALVSRGASLTVSNSGGMTPLLKAVSKGHLSVVEWLLSEGKSLLDEKDGDGYTALLLAAREGHLPMVQALVSQGASPAESDNDGVTPLLMASFFGHLPVVEWLLGEGKSSLDEKDKDGNTALLLAAQIGHLPMVQALVSQGASPAESGNDGVTPLLMASALGHLPVLEWLLGEGKSSLDEKDKDGNTALLWAAALGHLSIVKALVSRGVSFAECNKYALTSLLIASGMGHLSVVEWLLSEGNSSLDEKDEDGNTALIWAARLEHLAIVKALVARGVLVAERDERGMTPLILASSGGHLPMVEWLLEEGKSSLDEKDEDGNTALIWAARLGHFAIVKALVARGALVAERDNCGMTPLLIASALGHLPVMEWLLDEGKSSLDEKSKNGNTALLLAAYAGHLPMVKVLVSRGASPTVLNDDGMTPLLMASARGHLPVVEWLLEEGKSSLDEKDEDGYTALLWASREGHLPIVRYLVEEQGASPTESNNQGETALHIASEFEHSDIAEWLRAEHRDAIPAVTEQEDNASLSMEVEKPERKIRRKLEPAAASLVNNHTESVDAEAATPVIASSKKQVNRRSLFQEPKPQYLPQQKRKAAPAVGDTKRKRAGKDDKHSDRASSVNSQPR